MAKYKPTLYKLTENTAKTGQLGSTLAAGAIESVLNLATAYYIGALVYSCGNPKCDATFLLGSHTMRPLVCSKCGEDIDWTGIATRKIKTCPKCGLQYDLSKNFCAFHSPKLALSERDVPI